MNLKVEDLGSDILVTGSSKKIDYALFTISRNRGNSEVIIHRICV
jgi:hypothetical protein